jgi:hypothetical protein
MMQNNGCKPTVETYGSLMEVCKNCKEPRLALKVFKKAMKEVRASWHLPLCTYGTSHCALKALVTLHLWHLSLCTRGSCHSALVALVTLHSWLLSLLFTYGAVANELFSGLPEELCCNLASSPPDSDRSAWQPYCDASLLPRSPAGWRTLCLCGILCIEVLVVTHYGCAGYSNATSLKNGWLPNMPEGDALELQH